MESPKIISIGNKVILKKGTEPITQTITMADNADHLINFVTDFPSTIINTEGKEVPSHKKGSAFHIDKSEDGKYTLTFENIDVQKDKNDKSLASFLGVADAGQKSLTLDLQVPPSTVAMYKKQEEICFEITVESGKTYLIKTNATSISVESDGEKFSYTPHDATVECEMHTDIISEFFDKNKPLCKTFSQAKYTRQKNDYERDHSKPFPTGLSDQPERMTDFPVKVLAMFAKLMEPNEQKAFGDFVVTSLRPVPPKEGEDETSYFFIQKKSTNKNYFLIGGKLLPCDNYFLQYRQETDMSRATKNIPYLVVETDTGRTKNYFNLGLGDITDDQLSEDATKAIELIDKVAHQPVDTSDKAKSSAITYKGHTDSGSTGKDLSFYYKDSREYSDVPEFDLDGKTYEMFSDDPTPEDETPGHDDIGSGAPSDQEPEKPAEKPPAKKITPPPPPVKEEEKKFSKHVEAISESLGIIAVFMLIGAMLTGLGGLMIFGLVLGGFCSAGYAFSDKFKYTPIKNAMKKVKEYEDMENEDSKFAENFASAENDLDKMQEAAGEKGIEFESLLVGKNPEFGDFAELYNEYGIGFSDRLKEYRSSSLATQEGHKIKQSLLLDLKAIENATDNNARNQMIEQMIATHFAPMPQDKKQEFIDSFFGDPTKETPEQIQEKSERRAKFTRTLSESVAYEETYLSAVQRQSEQLGTARDSMITKYLKGKSPEQLERFFLRYSSVLARRFINDENISEEKLNEYLSVLPEEVQPMFTDAIDFSLGRIQSADSHIAAIAQENHEKIIQVNNAETYARTLETIHEKPEDIESFVHIKNTVKEFIVNSSISDTDGRNANIRTRDRLKNLGDTLPSDSDAKKILNRLNNVVAAPREKTQEDVKKAYEALQQAILEQYSDEITEEYVQGLEGSDPYLANLSGKTPANKDAQAGTIEAIAKRIIKTSSGPKAQNIATLYEEFIKQRKQLSLENFGKEDHNNSKSNNIKEIESYIRLIYTKRLESKLTAQIGPRVRAEEEAKPGITPVQINGAIKEAVRKALDRDTVLVVTTEQLNAERESLRSSLYFRELSKNNPELADSIARQLILIDRIKNAKIVSDDELTALNETSEVLRKVASGVVAQSDIDGVVFDALGGEEVSDKTLQDNKTDIKKKIQGYKAALAMIDSFTFISPRERNALKRKFKRSVFDISKPAEELSKILQEGMGKRIIAENDLSYDEIVQKCGPDVSGVIKRVKENRKLSSKQKDAVIRELKNREGYVDFEGVLRSALGSEEARKHQSLANEIESYQKQVVDTDKLTSYCEGKRGILNSQASAETSCHSLVLGQEYCEKELSHRKRLLDKGKSEDITTYDSVYTMLEEKFGISEDKIEEQFLKNPKIKPKQLATNLGIDLDEFKKALKNVRNKGLSDDAQKAYWLKKKEVKEHSAIFNEFKNAWGDAREGDIIGLKKFVQKAIAPKKGGKRSKDEIKKQREVEAFLKNLGIDAIEFSEILEGDQAVKIIQQMDTKHPITVAGRILGDEKQKLQMLKQNTEQLTGVDRQNFNAVKDAQDFADDLKEFRTKIAFLRNLDLPASLKADAFEAFATGNSNFFKDTRIGDKSLSEMLVGYEFSPSDLALFKRLKIKARDLKSSKNREKKIKEILQQLVKQEKKIKSNLDKSAEKANDNNKGDADLSKKPSAEVKKNTSFLKRIIDRVKENYDKEKKIKDKLKEKEAKKEETRERTDESKRTEHRTERGAPLESSM